MMWKETPIPVEGDELNLDWGEYELACVVEDALSAKVFNGEKRRLWLRVIDHKLRSDGVGEPEKKDEDRNSISDIRAFLNTSENPVPMAEFSEFWKELTDEEKEEFKTTPLHS